MTHFTAAATANLTEQLKELFSLNVNDLSVWSMLVTVAVSLVLGFAVSRMYVFSQKRQRGETALSMTLFMVPAIVSIIVLLIGDSIAGALTLGGAFSLIRYRSDPASPKDITYIFFAFATGIACGLGYPLYAALFTVIFILILLAVTFAGMDKATKDNMTLKVTVPEDMNFEGLLDDILKEYTEHFTLHKIRTTDFGTLVELVYDIRMARDGEKKKMIDAIRCRNGNLNVALTLKATDAEK